MGRVKQQYKKETYKKTMEKSKFSSLNPKLQAVLSPVRPTVSAGGDGQVLVATEAVGSPAPAKYPTTVQARPAH